MTNESIIKKARKKIKAAILEGDLTKAVDELTIAVEAIRDNDKQTLHDKPMAALTPKDNDS